MHSFNAKAGDTVRVELNGKNPLAYLTLIQPDGKEMVPAETRGLLLTLPMDGQYSVKVFLFRDGAGSDGKPVDYRLRVLPVK
ncbi:MAG TPA: PPC domain-containing protein [Rivihabitans pingtungensis]|nr:PPC domain-containing protein [Rivihabitans pingtungensis]